jgi:hypothetical protein
MKTLENTYCRPTTEAEWDLLPNRDLWCRNEDAVFGAIDFRKQKVSGKTEIFVQHFIDLLEDKIVPWRLEEVGFTYIKDHTPFYEFSLSKVSNLSWAESTSKHGIALEIREEQIWFSINNFTDLLTLIKFLK